MNALLDEAQADPKKPSEWMLFLVRKSISQFTLESSLKLV
jgi:hypothetical protein